MIKGRCIIPLCPAVFVTVCLPDGVMLPFVKDVGGGHIIRQETDLHFGGDELHGNIVIRPVDRDSGIPVDPAGHTVHKTFVQPCLGSRHLYLHAGAAVPFQWDIPDPGMVRGIMAADIA